MPLSSYQSRPREDRQVRRHGVLWNVHLTRQFASRHALRLTADQQPERVEASCLGERSQCGDGLYVIHISRVTDICDDCKTVCSRFLGRRSNRNPLHFIERDFVARSVIKLGGARTFVRLFPSPYAHPVICKPISTPAPSSATPSSIRSDYPLCSRRVPRPAAK